MESKRIVQKTVAVVVLAAIYCWAAKLGLSLAIVNASASAIWPPSGIALAAILIWGSWLWPGIFLGAFLANFLTQGTWMTSLGIATGNTLEAWLGAWLVNLFAGGPKAFEKSSDILKFMLLAALLSTTLSPIIGVTTLSLGGFVPRDQLSATWFTWWLGDSAAAMVLAPCLILWLTKPVRTLKPAELIEAAGLVLAVVWVGEFVFFGKNPFGNSSAPLGYLALLPLIWAAFRFGQRGAAACTILTSVIALKATLKGIGPFKQTDPGDSLLFLQAFMGVLSSTGLVLASVISERERAERRLRVQEAVSRVLAGISTVQEASPGILKTLCEGAGWDFGSIWNVREDTKSLVCTHVWHPAALSFPQFTAETRKQNFLPGIGLPGTVWTSGKSAWIADVTKDPNFPRAAAAVQDGLHAGFGCPIRSGDGFLGVIECFSREIREPDAEFLKMAGEVGTEFGRFIELRRAEEDLRKAHSELERRVLERTAELARTNSALEAEIAAHIRAEADLTTVEEGFGDFLESAPDAIVIVSREGRITRVNKQTELVFGYERRDLLGQPLEVLLPKRYRRAHVAHRDHFFAGPRARPMGTGLELFGRRKDGSEFPVEISLSPIQTTEGPLVCGIIRDVADRKRLEAEILGIAEREQRRISQDLHDGLGQQLAGLWCLSEVLRKNLDEQHSQEAPGAAKIAELLKTSLAQTRSLARTLYPIESEPGGLMSALETLATSISSLFKIKCSFQCETPVQVENETVANHLYKIAQEAVTNSIRHGKPQKIDIVLSSNLDEIYLTVTDDGCGLGEEPRMQQGMGMRIMNYRASKIGGSLVFMPGDRGGTCVVCTVPVNGRPESSEA